MRRVLVVLGFLAALSAGLYAEQLKSGYVVCESGDQLRWFIDLQDLDSSSQSHPQPWQVPMKLDGGVLYVDQAREAYANGWCKSTSDLTDEPTQVLETCDKHLPYPNGGCRKVRVRGAEWYTFADAVESRAGAPNIQSDSSIQFDTKGVEFGPWIRRFIAQVKRNWNIPNAAYFMRGHVVVTFNVHKDGSVTDLTVLSPSAVGAFNDAAYKAVLASNPTQALPDEYPDDHAFFTVTFYYNETPNGSGTPEFPSKSSNQPDAASVSTIEDPLIEGLTQSDVRARFGPPHGVDVNPGGVTIWYYDRRSKPTLTIYFVGSRASIKPPW